LVEGARPLPDYRLINFLGRGGYGEVWKAEGPGGFHVALKFVRLDDQNTEEEVQSLDLIKTLRHANLLVHFGSWRCHPYLIIAMELADKTLDDRLQEVKKEGQSGIPFDELIPYMRDAAKGIDYLNERHHEIRPGGAAMRIYHLDVKPQNLLLFGGTVKVADFSLARWRAHSITRKDGAMTLAFAAPEFFAGRMTPSSDQYCLASSYCQLRCGHLPFAGTNDCEILGAKLSQEPDLTRLPEAERRAVARALQRQEDARWGSCQEFVEALSPAAITLRRQAPMPPCGLLLVPAVVVEAGQSVRLEVRLRRAGCSGAAQLEVVGLPWKVTARAEDPTSDQDSGYLEIIAADDVDEVLSQAIQVRARLGTLEAEQEIALTVRAAPRLRILPVAPVTVQAGESMTVEVTVRRRNLPAPVGLSLAGLPPGVRGQSLGIPEDQDVGKLELQADRSAISGLREVQIVASACQTSATAPLRLTVSRANLERTIEQIRTGAISYLQRGEPDLAILYCEKAIDLLADDAAVYNCRGVAYAAKGEYANAIADYTQAIQIRPDYVSAYCNRALVYQSRQEYDLAIADYTTAIELASDDAEAYYGRGGVYDDSREYDLAIADYSWAIELRADYAEAYSDRGVAYQRKGDHDQAIADYTAAIALTGNAPGAARAYNNRGSAAEEKGNHSQAMADYDQAILIDPQYAHAYNNRGNIYRKKTQYVRAIADFTQAIQLEPANAIAYANRGSTYSTIKEYDLAIADYTRALTLLPSDADTYYKRGDAYCGKNDYKEAIKDYTEAIHLNPSFADAFYKRSFAYSSAGDVARAQQDREMSLSLGKSLILN
jgi:tetratricopeptide (TPR) repeat protein